MKTDQEMEDIIFDAIKVGSEWWDPPKIHNFVDNRVFLEGMFTLDHLKSMVTAWEKAL